MVSEDRSLAGKVALVTGGSSGLGAAIAERYRLAGAKVAIADLEPPAVSEFHYVPTDVSEFASIESAVESTVSWADRIDILVNNAAIQPHGISLDQTSPELLDKVFKTNSHSVFFGIQLAGRFLSEGGSVINTSSFVGTIGVPNCPSYAASKAALDHLTRVGALELAPRKITVNAVAPGLVLTPAVTEIADNPEIPFMEKRTALGRAATVDDITPLYEFLASDQARFITGTIIPVDGGVAAGWAEYDLTPPNWWQG